MLAAYTIIVSSIDCIKELKMKSKNLDTNQFYFESDALAKGESCERLTVTISHRVTKYDSDYSIESIENEQGEPIKIEDLPKSEQERLDKQLERFFENNIDIFYQESIEAEEDRRFSQYKDYMKYGDF